MIFDTLLKDYVSSDAKKNKTEQIDAANETSENRAEPSTKNDDEKKGCTNDEVLAVLAHELGHWKGNHVLKQMILSQVIYIIFHIFEVDLYLLSG